MLSVQFTGTEPQLTGSLKLKLVRAKVWTRQSTGKNATKTSPVSCIHGPGTFFILLKALFIYYAYGPASLG